VDHLWTTRLSRDAFLHLPRRGSHDVASCLTCVDCNRHVLGVKGSWVPIPPSRQCGDFRRSQRWPRGPERRSSPTWLVGSFTRRQGWWPTLGRSPLVRVSRSVRKREASNASTVSHKVRSRSVIHLGEDLLELRLGRYQPDRGWPPAGAARNCPRRPKTPTRAPPAGVRRCGVAVAGDRTGRRRAPEAAARPYDGGVLGRVAGGKPDLAAARGLTGVVVRRWRQDDHRRQW
jgi:hypothetical protein